MKEKQPITEALANRQCAPCPAGTPPLNTADANTLLTHINAAWVLNADATVLTRRFEFKGFAKASYFTNLCVWLADDQHHHPDIALGFGYTQVSLTTHSVNGLSDNDFIWAAKLDRFVDNNERQMQS